MKDIGLDMSDYGKVGYKVTVDFCFSCKNRKIVYIIDKVKHIQTNRYVKPIFDFVICQYCIMKDMENIV